MRPEDHWEDTFGSHAAQEHAAQLGMWIFLGTELLLFGAIFAAWGVYRESYPDAFRDASSHLKTDVALVQTLMLITTSFLVTLSIYFVKKGRGVLAAALLVAVILIGAGFVGIKGWEWHIHAQEGALPGEWYHFEKVPQTGGSLFYTFYWILTGLHVTHLGIGVFILAFIAFKAAAGAYDAQYNVQFEICAMYWHFVDVIWILIYTALYLAA